MKIKLVIIMTLLAVSLMVPVAYATDQGGSSIEMVSIPDRNYEMGKYEVTQDEWRAVMGNNPSRFSSCGDGCPVEQVSWDDIQVFLQKLNAKTGRQYRLPNESEWEYACSGGSKTDYCGGNNLDAVGWYAQNSGSKTHQVGQKQANGYGLYDMSGNVLEWMSDCEGSSCGGRVVGGGCWDDYQYHARATSRGYYTTATRTSGIGFRVVRSLP
jgi:formylglycine-generating enzyme required for sulfatase activity